MRPERPRHIAGARPRAHQLGVPAEPIAHQPVEQPHLLGDLGDHRVEIGARAHMLALGRPRRLQRVLELRERRGGRVTSRRPDCVKMR